MTDIASIALKIDTSQISSATTALKQLTDSASPAEKAVARLENASARSGTATKQLAQQTGLARFEMVNLSRQVQDVGVSLASGQSPFLVLIQQGTQIQDIFSSSQGTFRGFVGQIASAITPTRLLAGGLVAVGAGAFAAVSYWKSFALTLDDTARAAGVTVETMAKLQAVASFKGVANDDFAKGMQNFAAQIYQAKNNAGELREVFRVNGIAIKDNADALERVADLIQNATSYQQKLSILQKAGLPTSAEFVRFMEQGGAKIRQASEEAAKFGGIANDNMVAKARQFDEAWNRVWTNFGLRSKQVIAEAAEGFSNLGGKGSAFAYILEKLQTNSARFQSAFKNRPVVTVDQNGSTANAAPTVDPDAIRNVEQMTDAIRRQAEQQKVEIAAQGLSISQGTALRTLQEQLIDAKFRHIQISDETIAKLKEEAQVVGRLAQANAELALKQQVGFEREQLGRTDADQQVAERLRQIFGADYASHMNDNIAAQIRFNDTLRTTKQVAEDALSGFLTDLAQGKSASEALGNVLKNLELQLIRVGSNRIVSGLIGGASSEGGLLATLLHHSGYGPGDTSAIRLVNPNAFIGAPRFHSGIGPGEKAAVIRNDESVLTPGQMKALGNMTRGGNTTVNVIGAPAGTEAKTSTDAQGNTRIDVWLSRHIDDTVSSMLDSGQSSINRTLERRYGVNPRL